jgi:hypothetical protein
VLYYGYELNVDETLRFVRDELGAEGVDAAT